MYGKAKITLQNGRNRIFNANDEESISEYLRMVIGDIKEEHIDIPTYIEASSWCPLASIGDTFERDAFIIEIIE